MIACMAMLVMALMMNDAPIVVLSAILLGSLIGFLRYSFLPASVFMGDSGALFLDTFWRRSRYSVIKSLLFRSLFPFSFWAYRCPHLACDRPAQNA